MRAGVLAILGCVLAGCLQGPGGGSASSAECREGSGPLFLKVKGGAGFVPPSFIPTYWSIDRQGDLFRFSGEWARQDNSGGAATGTGRIGTSHAKLHNITGTQVREELERLGIWRTDRDWNVTVAYRTWIGEADFGTWCTRALADLYNVSPSPSRTNCADDPWFRIDVSSQRGSHWVTASAAQACDDAPARLHAFFDDFQTFTQEKERPFLPDDAAARKP